MIDDQLFEILVKFDRPGPRYTSYPTAPIFSSNYTVEQFEDDIKANNFDNKNPISLYLHIPFCDTLCYFCACNSIITNNRKKISEYLDYLKKEIDHVSSFISKGRKVVQLAWGGGTPSYLKPEEIADLSDLIKKKFAFGPDAEISVEIDPRGLSIDHLKAFIDGGANRFSIGVQDFDNNVQAAVNRVQPELLTRRVVKQLRELGIKSINIDLIYGLPLQTIESFKATLEKVIELSPERIAVFNFAYVPWIKAHQKILHQDQLPAADDKLRLLQLAVNSLTNAGYVYIGMDHFAKPNDELALEQKNKRLQRNFQGYSIKAGTDLYGFGVSAISHFGRVYAQNAKDLSEYCDKISKGGFSTILGYKMSRDDEIRKYVIMRLMCDLELDKREVEKKFGIVFDEYFLDSLEKLKEFLQLNLITFDNGRILITQAGRFVLRNIAMCFDKYLPGMPKEKQVFSRTV
ncbi:MAG: oxygen-independent coproporphyrinogen III oxidase [Bacteroidetes bacterium]|nr:oxygen-independent coproporphyrinogen III oxidase [Bacteroidota bacterium]